MATKRIFQCVMVLALLVTSFTSSSRALAWGCASYITVQWGDTLSGIAATCGTSVEAIQAVNPGLGWWLYAGQVLRIPTGYVSAPVQHPNYSGTYVVQKGDTLAKIAARIGVSWRDILAVNPQIWNPSLIYTGQVINLPGSVSGPPPTHYPPPSHPTYPPAPGGSSGLSTLTIAYKHGLFVRSAPGGSIIASALNNTEWRYKKDSIFIDSKWKVWTEVTLSPPVKGYSTGWILVKDQLGTYFTDPQIDK
ncbi:MAG: LysM peptidoglycan-binding domain-containing protein [Chloroflexota bacterium]|nr:LysM peptidoglycan-binding domain-containing protein [Chloroflexota bacterium]